MLGNMAFELVLSVEYANGMPYKTGEKLTVSVLVDPWGCGSRIASSHHLK